MIIWTKNIALLSKRDTSKGDGNSKILKALLKMGLTFYDIFRVNKQCHYYYILERRM